MKNYLVDSFFLEYAGLKLHARYLSSQDEINQRLAPHEFIKVDGAYQEFMGSGADSYRFTLLFWGDSWRRDFVAAVAHFKRNPKGSLHHPVHGWKRVGWTRISSPVEPGRETNAATATVQFTEDNLSPGDGQPPTAQGQAQAAVDAAATLDDTFASIPPAAIKTIAAIRNLSAMVINYSASALAIAQGGPPDPSLPLALAGINVGLKGAMLALAADADVAEQKLADSSSNKATRDSATAVLDYQTTARPALINAYAACLALDAALQSLQPPLELVVLGGAISLSRLCGDRYGSKGMGMRELILALNRIPQPALIPAGTRLLMPTPVPL